MLFRGRRLQTVKRTFFPHFFNAAPYYKMQCGAVVCVPLLPHKLKPPPQYWCITCSLIRSFCTAICILVWLLCILSRTARWVMNMAAARCRLFFLLKQLKTIDSCGLSLHFAMRICGEREGIITAKNMMLLCVFVGRRYRHLSLNNVAENVRCHTNPWKSFEVLKIIPKHPFLFI